jgi:hypothetical protein
LNLAAGALGLTAGFATKGMVGVLIPAIATLCFILYTGRARVLLNWKTLLVLPLFGLFIFPVLYCYYLQFNLHPETVVRGKDHINGVRFILFGQGVERYGGQMAGDAAHEPFFFLYTFIWAFGPWSLIVYPALVDRLPSLRKGGEWVSAASFIVIAIIITFAASRLPHYLNICFPFASVLAASVLCGKNDKRWTVYFSFFRVAVVMAIIIISVLINGWLFPVKSTPVLIAGTFVLVILLYTLFTKRLHGSQKNIIAPVVAMALLFLLLNGSFYPQLLRYQGGNVLSEKIKDSVDVKEIYCWPGFYSSSFNFYTASLRQEFNSSTRLPAYLLYDIQQEKEILAAGYILREKLTVKDFEISKLDKQFLLPSTREGHCTSMILARIYR